MLNKKSYDGKQDQLSGPHVDAQIIEGRKRWYKPPQEEKFDDLNLARVSPGSKDGMICNSRFNSIASIERRKDSDDELDTLHGASLARADHSPINSAELHI